MRIANSIRLKIEAPVSDHVHRGPARSEPFDPSSGCGGRFGLGRTVNEKRLRPAFSVTF
jgi:hypothetical protein